MFWSGETAVGHFVGRGEDHIDGGDGVERHLLQQRRQCVLGNPSALSGDLLEAVVVVDVEVFSCDG